MTPSVRGLRHQRHGVNIRRPLLRQPAEPARAKPACFLGKSPPVATSVNIVSALSLGIFRGAPRRGPGSVGQDPTSDGSVTGAPTRVRLTTNPGGHGVEQRTAET